jgi:hypothetical protein
VGYFTTHGSPSQNNIVRANHVHHVMQEVDDGAGIYVFNTHFDYHDKSSRLYVVRNFIHDVKRGPYTDWNPIGGFYLDEGTQAVVIKDNVVRDVTTGCTSTPAADLSAKRCRASDDRGKHRRECGYRSGGRPARPAPAARAPGGQGCAPVRRTPATLSPALNGPQTVGPAALHGNPTFEEGALALNGQNQWLALPKVDPGNRYTVAMWVKIPAGTTGERTLLSGTDFRLVAHVSGDKVERVESWNKVNHNEGGQDVYHQQSYPAVSPPASGFTSLGR